MTDKQEIEVWIVMDSDGDYAAGGTEDEAKKAFEENIGGSGPRRIVKLPVRMTPPAVEETAEIDIPDTAGTNESIEAEAA